MERCQRTATRTSPELLPSATLQDHSVRFAVELIAHGLHAGFDETLELMRRTIGALRVVAGGAFLTLAVHCLLKLAKAEVGLSRDGAADNLRHRIDALMEPAGNEELSQQLLKLLAVKLPERFVTSSRPQRNTAPAIASP